MCGPESQKATDGLLFQVFFISPEQGKQAGDDRLCVEDRCRIATVSGKRDTIDRSVRSDLWNTSLCVSAPSKDVLRVV